MSIGARCGSCTRELLLGQLVQPSDGFRCPFCGFAFAPAYATVAPGVAARAMAAQAALVTALAELGSMTGDRLRLDRTTILDPIINTLPQTLPQVDAEQPGLARRRHTAGGPAMLPPSPPKLSRTDDRQPEISRLPMLAEGITLSAQVDLPGAASTTRRTRSDLLRTGPAQSGLRACGCHSRYPSRAAPTVSEDLEQPFRSPCRSGGRHGPDRPSP
jgi:hypothetical protein